MPTKLLFPHLQSMHIESVTLDGNTVTLAVAVKGTTAPCPLCRCPSTRVHSRYRRTVADLPVSGRAVVIVAQVRRFRCLASIRAGAQPWARGGQSSHDAHTGHAQST